MRKILALILLLLSLLLLSLSAGALAAQARETRQSAALHPSPAQTTRYTVLAGDPAGSTTCRGSYGASRTSGSSMAPSPRGSSPPTTARYVFRIAPCSRAAASWCFARMISPLVSLSSRPTARSGRAGMQSSSVSPMWLPDR